MTEPRLPEGIERLLAEIIGGKTADALRREIAAALEEREAERLSKVSEEMIDRHDDVSRWADKEAAVLYARAAAIREGRDE